MERLERLEARRGMGLPNGLDDPLKEYINRAHISRVKDNFFPKRLDTQQRKTYKSLRSDLKKLFDYRNAIMHSGQKEGLTALHCHKIINSVHELSRLLIFLYFPCKSSFF